MIIIALKYAVCAVLGYLLGCSNMAYYLGRIRGVDLRSAGSGNLGASNAMVLMGWKYGIITAVHDILKAALAVHIAKVLFPSLALAGAVGGVCSVLGHIFPFYLRFRGGKGFASYFGMMAMLDLKFCLVLAVVCLIVTLVTDYIVLATTTTVLTYPLYITLTQNFAFTALLILLALTILYKHRENYVRICQGSEIGLRRANRGDDRIK